MEGGGWRVEGGAGARQAGGFLCECRAVPRLVRMHPHHDRRVAKECGVRAEREVLVKERAYLPGQIAAGQALLLPGERPVRWLVHLVLRSDLLCLAAQHSYTAVAVAVAAAAAATRVASRAATAAAAAAACNAYSAYSA